MSQIIVCGLADADGALRLTAEEEAAPDEVVVDPLYGCTSGDRPTNPRWPSPGRQCLQVEFKDMCGGDPISASLGDVICGQVTSSASSSPLLSPPFTASASRSMMCRALSSSPTFYIHLSPCSGSPAT